MAVAGHSITGSVLLPFDAEINSVNNTTNYGSNTTVRLGKVVTSLRHGIWRCQFGSLLLPHGHYSTASLNRYFASSTGAGDPAMKLQQLITEAVVNGLVESEVTYDDYKSGTAFPGGSGGTGDTTSDNEVNYNLGTSADWQSDDVVAQINAAWAAGLDAWAAVDFKVVTGDVANGTIVSSEGTEDFRPYIDYTLDYPEPYYTTLNSEPYATQQHRTAAKIGFHVGSRTFDTNCQARIAYGKTTALGNTTSWVSLNGAVENQLVQVDVTGLDEGEFYYFSVEFDIDGDNVADFATEVSS